MLILFLIRGLSNVNNYEKLLLAYRDFGAALGGLFSAEDRGIGRLCRLPRGKSCLESEGETSLPMSLFSSFFVFSFFSIDSGALLSSATPDEKTKFGIGKLCSFPICSTNVSKNKLF